MACKLKYVGKFTEDQDDILVTYIQEYRDIYDPRSVFYKAINVRNRIWQSIATKLNKTDDECKTRWKHIRDSYNRHRRKPVKWYLENAKNKSKIRFFEKLRFLDEITDYKKDETQAEGNDEGKPAENIITLSPEHRMDEELDDCNDNEGIQLKNPLEDIPEDTQYTCYTHAKKPDIYDQKSKQPYQRNEEGRRRNEKDSDDEASFGMHVATVLKKLAPRLKIQAKNEIFGILSKYETLNLDLVEQSPSFTGDGECSIKIELDN